MLRFSLLQTKELRVCVCVCEMEKGRAELCPWYLASDERTMRDLSIDEAIDMADLTTQPEREGLAICGERRRRGAMTHRHRERHTRPTEHTQRTYKHIHSTYKVHTEYTQSTHRVVQCMHTQMTRRVRGTVRMVLFPPSALVV